MAKINNSISLKLKFHIMPIYKNTIFLPKTKFSIKVIVPQKETEILEKWKNNNIYKKSIIFKKKEPIFTLHDGPPYANGHIHLGHALNKILKDFIIRSKNMMGFNTPFIPGWDCHGLPIEWKVEENYLKKGNTKKTISIEKMRQKCKNFANKWINIQKKELKQLGLMANWDNSYTTMNKKNEAIIIQELNKFLYNGAIYRSTKPVLWSIKEETALAEAEVEYQEKQSISIYVKFPIIKSTDLDLIGTKAIIWTTTPWTIPTNQAIAFGNNITYTLAEITNSNNNNIEKKEKILVGENLLEKIEKNANIYTKTIKKFLGTKLHNIISLHPLYSQGYQKKSPFFHSNHVKISNGTGLVHIAPDHGPEDFDISKQNRINIIKMVNKNGAFSSKTPIFYGMNIFDAEKLIIKSLKESGNLLGTKIIRHPYLHSWRSKAPLIYKSTAQWFISMSHNNLKTKSIQILDKINWHPKSSQQRLIAMIKEKPDWCISRQRAWGIPLSLFINKNNGLILKDIKIQNRIAEIYKKHGSGIWFKNPSYFLHPEYCPNNYHPVMDTLDIWFESGCSHAYILENNPQLLFPADIYVEGSDQHRGWFQSSLIESYATRLETPFKSIITHGFILNEKGHKMSKSINNSISPNNIIKKIGAEIIRLWIANSDVTEDIRFSNKTIKYNQDIYKRIRNTFRYLLGGLYKFSKNELIKIKQMPELELWILAKIYSIDIEIKDMYENYNFQNSLQKIHHFCAIDLSSFYFNIRKDSLYCDTHNNLKRKSVRTIFFYLTDILTKWLAPILCFTSEEVWQHWNKSQLPSIHLSQFKRIPNNWKNDLLKKKYEKIRKVLKLITSSIEEKRKAGIIYSSLQARLNIFDPHKIIPIRKNWAEISITSSVHITNQNIPQKAHSIKECPQIGIIVKQSNGKKCQRCWKISPETLSSSNKDLCARCEKIITLKY